MKRHPFLLVALLSTPLLMGGNCSRARVESMNAMNEGVVLAQQKRHVEAVKALERAAAVDPTNDQAMYNMALVHLELRKFERAKEDLNRAIAANPDIAGYHEKLGTVEMQLENWEGAKSAFEKAIAGDDGLFKAYFKLGQVYERLDDPQNALHQYTESIERGPRFLEAYSELGRLYAELGYLSEAIQVLEGGLQVAVPGTEEEANVHQLLGTVYQQQRNFDKAIDEFKAALEVVPSMGEALFSLGWTYSLVDNREEARRYLDKYVKSAGQNAPSHYMKAAQDRLNELQTP